MVGRDAGLLAWVSMVAALLGAAVAGLATGGVPVTVVGGSGWSATKSPPPPRSAEPPPKAALVSLSYALRCSVGRALTPPCTHYVRRPLLRTRFSAVMKSDSWSDNGGSHATSTQRIAVDDQTFIVVCVPPRIFISPCCPTPVRAPDARARAPRACRYTNAVLSKDTTWCVARPSSSPRPGHQPRHDTWPGVRRGAVPPSSSVLRRSGVLRRAPPGLRRGARPRTGTSTV